MRSDEDMIRGLKTFKLFSRLPDEDLACLAEVMEEKNFPAGTVILREGDSGDQMFLLLEGIMRRPVNKKVEGTLQMITVVLLLFLMVYVMYNDLTRLLTP